MSGNTASKSTPTLPELLAAVQDLTTAYREADRNASVAARLKTEALNRLNAAQKAWDEASSKLRENAPLTSDWNRT